MFNKLQQTFKKLPTWQKLAVVAIVSYVLYKAYNKYNQPMYYEQYEKYGSSNNVRFSKPAFTMFYMNGCGYCDKVMPSWKRLRSDAVDILTIERQDEAVMKKHGVKSFPTIRYFPQGIVDYRNFVEYSGDRSYEDLQKFLRNN